MRREEEEEETPFNVRHIVPTNLLKLFTLKIAFDRPKISQKELRERIEDSMESRFSGGRFSTLLVDMSWRGLIFIGRDVRKNIGGGKGQMEIEITEKGRVYYRKNVKLLRRVVRKLTDIK